MYGEFEISIDKVKTSTEQYKSMYQEIQRYNESLAQIVNNLSGSSCGGIKSAIFGIMDENRVNIQGLKILENILLSIVKLYQDTENNILTIKVDYTKITFRDDISSSLDSDAKEDENVWDYILDSLWQAIAGDFSDESNLLGITLNVALGFVPVVGQICDVRDLIADIYNLIDDGPETSEWVALGFTAIGFIPGLGDFLKHGDELSPLLKNLDNIADGLGDAVNGIIKKGDEIFSAASKYVDDFNQFMDDKIFSKVADKIDDVVSEIPSGETIKNIVKDIMGKNIDIIDTSLGDVIKEWGKEIFNNTAQDWISDAIDWITGNDEVGDASHYNGNFKCVA